MVLVLHECQLCVCRKVLNYLLRAQLVLADLKIHSARTHQSVIQWLTSPNRSSLPIQPPVQMGWTQEECLGKEEVLAKNLVCLTQVAAEE